MPELVIASGYGPDSGLEVEVHLLGLAQLAVAAAIDEAELQKEPVLGGHAGTLDRAPQAGNLVAGERARAGQLLDLQVFLGVDTGKGAARDQLPPYSPFPHLLGVDQDALGGAGPRRRMFFQQVEPLVHAHLLGGQLADDRKDVQLELRRMSWWPFLFFWQ